jgi:hypothetical protein
MQRLPHENKGPKTLMQRLDRNAGELNTFLMVFAIGLAILDATCLTVLKLRDIPAIAYIGGSIQPASPAALRSALVQ